MNGTFSRLTLISFDTTMHRQSCNYWYAVRLGTSPHTAFTSRAALDAWLTLLNLHPIQPLPEEKTYGCCAIVGGYQEHCYSSLDELDAVSADRFMLTLRNGNYHCAKVTYSSTGEATIHYYHHGTYGAMCAINHAQCYAAIGNGKIEVGQLAYKAWSEANHKQRMILNASQAPTPAPNPSLRAV